jgi:transcriptional regulator with XRE-family HTH domain
MTEPERRSWLAAARERTGRSQDSLAQYLGVTAKTISSWERGMSTPRVDMRPDLAEALGLTIDELTHRLGLPVAPEQASSNGSNGFAVTREWMSLLVRAELAAHAIWTLGVAVLPALCQSAGYARAVEETGHRRFTAGEIDELVERRLARADALTTAEFTALIAAPLLDANKGGPEVMAEQMAHLLDLAGRPNVTLRIIDIEHLTAIAAPFTLVAQAGEAADLVAEAGHVGPNYDEGATAATDYARLFDHLMSLALDPDVSRARIARSADRFAAMANTPKKG